jgi:hypothetical protein
MPYSGYTGNVLVKATFSFSLGTQASSQLPGTGKPHRTTMTKTHRRSFWHRHSLSIVSGSILLLWIILYSLSDPSTHLGAFFGNAIADWTGLLVTVLATKFMYEKGSAESFKPPHRLFRPIWEKLVEHSLSIFLLITGLGWIALFAASDTDSKWGQVTGNIVSEWTQIFGLVILTKKLIETHSKESR